MEKTRHRKVYFEVWTKDGFQCRWLYGQRHMKFMEADVPKLYERALTIFGIKGQPKYLYRSDHRGIYIALFLDGFDPHIMTGQLQKAPDTEDAD